MCEVATRGGNMAVLVLLVVAVLANLYGCKQSSPTEKSPYSLSSEPPAVKHKLSSSWAA